MSTGRGSNAANKPGEVGFQPRDKSTLPGKNDIPTASDTPVQSSVAGTPAIDLAASQVNSMYETYQSTSISESEFQKAKYGPNGVAVAAFLKQLDEVGRHEYSNILFLYKEENPQALQDITRSLLGYSSLDSTGIPKPDSRYAEVDNAFWDIASLKLPRNSPFHRHYDKEQAYRAVKSAVLALIMRDQIPQELYDRATNPWRASIGRIHPDDELVRWVGK